MNWTELGLDALICIASVDVPAWNSVMRADPRFGRFALTVTGRKLFLAAHTKSGCMDGSTIWTVNGVIHRDDGPALVSANAAEMWYFHGKKHRVGGPAVIFPGDKVIWMMDDQIHRDDGPAVVAADRLTWYEHGEVHRLGAPAHFTVDMAVFVEKGEIHRADGPAVITADGDTWYSHGVEVDPPERM